MMYNSSRAGKNRTVLIRITANGDNNIKRYRFHFFDSLRLLQGYVHSLFMHDFYCVEIEAMCFESR